MRAVKQALWPSWLDPSLLILLIAAATLFAAGMSSLSLGSLDDAFYARKGVEMARAGRFFTVTWAETPTFQNPPLQIWLIGQSHRLLGEGDAAARFPALVMAIFTLLTTYRIGQRLIGRDAALMGVALLLMTPLFVENARGCMMEMPQVFWVSLAMLIAVEGRDRTNLLLLIAAPIAAGILTKSVLGMLPLLVLGALSVSQDYRKLWRNPQLWVGMAVGVALGSSWTVHQGLTFGAEAVRAHYLDEVGVRATDEFSLASLLFEYVRILLTDFHLVVIPGAVGIGLMWRSAHRALYPAHALLLAWAVVPLLVFNLSSARSARYVFPVLPALALAGGWWLRLKAPHLSHLLVSRIVPVMAITVALVITVSPQLLTRDRNGPFKESAAVLQQRISPSGTVPYLGDRYWEIANPLLYYAERLLAQSSASAEDAAGYASNHPDRLLIVDRDRLSEVHQLGIRTDTVLEGSQWVLLSLP